MTDCKPMATPIMMNLKKLKETSSDSGEIDPHLYKQLIESLMYLVNTRPDICYELSVLSQFMSQLRQTHWITACVEIFVEISVPWEVFPLCL